MYYKTLWIRNLRKIGRFLKKASVFFIASHFHLLGQTHLLTAVSPQNFIVQAPEPNAIKLFTVLIYKFS